MTITTPAGGRAAQPSDALVARTLRNAKAAIAAQGPMPKLPFRREDLFKEAAYTDGQPYARDDEDDDTEG